MWEYENKIVSIYAEYNSIWEDYNRSLTSEDFPNWDYIILTASNENQAIGYQKQLEIRKEFLPDQTHFAVIPDEGNVRIGSGGATLSVLRYIYQREERIKGVGSFSGLRILVIHSGGDSKRVPMYSALGKLFSPVPHRLSNGKSSTLFDEFLIAMASLPARIREGMVVLSGDVVLLFNPLQIDFSGRGAAAISFKENVETGKNHGVFLNSEKGTVKKFLHKQTVDILKNMGAVNENDCVDIDTGAIIFSTDILQALYSIIDTSEKYYKYVNDKVRLSLYGDFLYPLAEDSTLEQFYNEKPEGQLCEELYNARTIIWKILRPYRMKLLRLAPAKFIHFGTTKEILSLMCGGVKNYKALGWNEKINSSIVGNTAGYNSVLSGKAKIEENCYLEVSFVHSNAVIGRNVILSYIDIHNEIIPDNVVLHGLKQKNGKFVCRIYGIADNPKDKYLFGINLERIFKKKGIQSDNIWDSKEHSLWFAKLYPECDSIKEAVNSALNLYRIVHGEGNIEIWKKTCRKSLYSGFYDADPTAIIAWDKRMQELVKMDEIAKDIRIGKPVKETECLEPLTKIQKKWFEEKILKANFSEAIRLNYYTGYALGNKYGNKYMTDSFKTISEHILKSEAYNLQYNDKCRIVKEKHTVKMPLRVNWGGGWSDTPPICCELGGTVLNAAISLNGKLPVEVTLIKITEKKIVFDSRDMDVHGEFLEITELQKTGNPYDPFALQKACLLACGIIPYKNGNLKEILARFGGGFELHSEVVNVPKGSGLGTSSILSAACVKAIFEFMGIVHTEKDIYDHVLLMEQIMSTGGGWQDQVGGVTNGIKYITSKPGLRQALEITPEQYQYLMRGLEIVARHPIQEVRPDKIL